jgi:O-succinylbenzoate synthase
MIEIRTVHLREMHLPLVHYFETSFGRTYNRRIILVTAAARDGEGYGECTAGEEPGYSSETTDTAWHVLSDFLIPRVLGRRLESARDVDGLLAPVRGHRMAKAAIETAVWDYEAKSLGVPLHKHLGGVRSEIGCGVSIGIHPTLEALLEKVRREVAAGYRRIKIKIKPGWELEPLRGVRAEFPGILLMADANSAFTLADVPLLRKLDPLELMMIEQPLAHDDIVDHAALQKEIRTPICLDESIHSEADAIAAIEMGACRVINVKQGRVGGLLESIRIARACAARGVDVWSGGMDETGIGRAVNIHLQTVDGFTLPGDTSETRRYFQEDIVEPGVVLGPGGFIDIPPGPGTGVTVVAERLARYRLESERVR